MSDWQFFMLYLFFVIIIEMFIYKIANEIRRKQNKGIEQESIAAKYFFEKYGKCKQINESIFDDLNGKFMDYDIYTLKHAKSLLEADLALCVVGGVLFSVVQGGLLILCEIIPYFLFEGRVIGEKYNVMVDILCLVILVILCYPIYNLTVAYKREKYCIEVLKMVLEERKNEESNPEQREKDRKCAETLTGCGNSFKEKRKEIYKKSLRMLEIWLGYYAIVFIVYFILNVVIGIEYSSFKELIISFIFVFIILVFFELVSNIPIAIATEKKILSKDDIKPQLKDIPIDQYRFVLAGKEKDEILQMYRELYENNRRKFDISMQSVYGSLAIAFLPVVVTTLCAQYKEISSSDAINMFVAFIFALPLLLDVVLTVFNIIESDKVQRTSSVEKDTQDKIVKELAYEYLGIKKPE